MQYSALQCSTVQCSTLQCSALKCSAVKCSAEQCSVSVSVECTTQCTVHNTVSSATWTLEKEIKLLCSVMDILFCSEIYDVILDSEASEVEKEQGPSGTKHGLEVNLEDKNQVRPGISPSP